MKVTFLGTGTSQGIPIIACPCEVCHSSDPRDKRLRTSIFIEINGSNLVIDSGPDFRQQMLNANVQKLDAILFTHEHKDHVAGLDDIRAFNYIQQKPIDIYAEERVQWAIRQEFAYIFAEQKYPGVPQVEMNMVENNPFEIQGNTVIPIRALHMRLPVFGYRFGKFTYITDVNYISKEEKEKVKGSEVIVVNGLRMKKHISHFNLEEAIDFLQELNPKTGYITHISHQMGFYKEVQASLPKNIYLAYDGLVIDI